MAEVTQIRQVKLYKGTEAAIDALGERDPNSFYFITDKKKRRPTLVSADLTSLVDGTAITFDLPPAALQGYSVYVNGLLVLPASETETTFTLETAPEAGAKLVVVYLDIIEG